MTKKQNMIMAVLLVLLSAVVYTLHWLIFHDAHHIFIYLVGDIAFVFLEVLMVSLIIHRVLSDREKNAILKKLNMVISVFFDELGNELLGQFYAFDTSDAAIAEQLQVDPHWTDKQFTAAKKELTHQKFNVDSLAGDLPALKEMLVGNRDFLLRLLENPNLLEHESFSELLLAVFHLCGELQHRDSFTDLPKADTVHLSGDIKRAYQLLIREWLSHMQYLKKDYPYLFSLAIRLNPFKPDASAVIQQSA